jgi:hypothetical protein
MGHEIRIAWGSAPCPLAPVLEKLQAAGVPSIVVMVEGNLQAPHTPPPSDWKEVRLKCAAGTVTLRRGSDGIAVVVFANAEEPLKEAQQKVADALTATAG